MFDYLKKFDNKFIPPRSYNPKNPHNQMQVFADANTNLYKPLQQRIRDLQNFYKSKESADTNFNGA